jgi:hypothetical protein
VFLYHHEGLELPFFSLRPANILSKAGAALGQQSGLHERTGLSADHEVSADDEEAVQQLFSPDLVTYCNEHPEVFIEGDGTCLILYRRAVLVPADELDAFLKEGLQVLEMVTQSA